MELLSDNISNEKLIYLEYLILEFDSINDNGLIYLLNGFKKCSLNNIKILNLTCIYYIIYI